MASGREGEGFGERYRAAVSERGRLCAGIDPHPALLEQWGLPVSVDGLRAFAEACAAGLGPTAAVIKPQVAFFESFGAAGFAILEETIAGCRAAGALVLSDAKRGDIGSTMAAYTTAWLDDASPLCSDAVTVSPYLGFGALDPTLAQARATGRGVFVLARTSNPEGAALQTARVVSTRSARSTVETERSAVEETRPTEGSRPTIDRAGSGVGVRSSMVEPGRNEVTSRVETITVAQSGEGAGSGVGVWSSMVEPGRNEVTSRVETITVAQSVVDAAAAVNADGSGTVGLVVGATREHGLDLTALDGPILSPGLGAQGATAADLAAIFGDTADLRWLLPAASRSILAAGPDPAALAAAVAATRDEIEAALRRR